MRPTSFAKLSTATAAGLVLVTAMLAAPAPARAADDDGEAFDTKILRGILEGIGLERDGKERIDYHERSPLVIPGNKALPAPQSTDAIIANNPAWPKDPDVERRKEIVRQAKKGVSSEEIDSWARPLSPSELMPGGDRRRTGPAPKIAQPAGVEGQRLSADELGYRGNLFGNMFGGSQERSVRFTGEPARTSLTEPPPGYQTPSPEQPYGEGRADSAPKAADATEERIKDANK
jgi:hypothetical protein